jgi:hypothetical protein
MILSKLALLLAAYLVFVWYLARDLVMDLAKPKPEKKPETPAPATIRALPMELQLGDRPTDETGEWEVISRPFVSAGGKIASAHVRRVGRPDGTWLRGWSAHERISVRRAAAEEGKR